MIDDYPEFYVISQFVDRFHMTLSKFYNLNYKTYKVNDATRDLMIYDGNINGDGG